jgi:hypothetical protein
MPEMGQSGSEGGVALIPPSLPLSLSASEFGFNRQHSPTPPVFSAKAEENSVLGGRLPLFCCG